MRRLCPSTSLKLDPGLRLLSSSSSSSSSTECILPFSLPLPLSLPSFLLSPPLSLLRSPFLSLSSAFLNSPSASSSSNSTPVYRSTGLVRLLFCQVRRKRLEDHTPVRLASIVPAIKTVVSIPFLSLSFHPI